MSAQRQLFAPPPGRVFDPADIKTEGVKLGNLLAYLEYAKLNISTEPTASSITDVLTTKPELRPRIQLQVVPKKKPPVSRTLIAANQGERPDED
jgi:hypothetical protein